MKVSLCYAHNSIMIRWDFPFLPRIGESISLCDIITEKQNEKLFDNRDFFRIVNISWFPSKTKHKNLIEIIME